MTGISANFSFLADHDLQLTRLAALAERYFADDPNTCLIKLRQFGELLAQQTAARYGLFNSTEEPQADLLRRLKLDGGLPRQVLDLFHQIRILGNAASHQQQGTHTEALVALKLSRQLAIWFHRTFTRNTSFKPGPFVPPPDAAIATQELHTELARLQGVLEETRTVAEKARADAEAHARARETAEQRAQREAEERAVWENLAAEAEQAKLALQSELASVQASAEQAPAAEIAAVEREADIAATRIDLDEAETRLIVDRQLRARGWQADSEKLTYAAGARPVKNANLAIAEWPTATGPADYALFAGTTLVGVVEAKRHRKNVSAALTSIRAVFQGCAICRRRRTCGSLGGIQGAVPIRHQRAPVPQANRDRKRHLVSRCAQDNQRRSLAHRLVHAGRSHGRARHGPGCRR